MQKWEFPLHFIDFETCMIAIPFHKNRTPYEQIAFQFSCHTLYEDGKMCRDFVNIEDVIRANLLMLENDSVTNQVFCVGGGKAYTVKEFANEVAKIYGFDYLLPVMPGEYRFGDTRHACSDISKIKKLGWTPQNTIQDSIKQYKDYLEDTVEKRKDARN